MSRESNEGVKKARKSSLRTCTHRVVDYSPIAHLPSDGIKMFPNIFLFSSKIKLMNPNIIFCFGNLLVLVLSWFCSGFVLVFVLVLSWFCPDFILIFSWLYPYFINFILIFSIIFQKLTFILSIKSASNQNIEGL